MKRKKGIQGFTLAELLIVVAIIAVLVAISVPIFTARLEKAREAVCMSNRRELQGHIATELMSGDGSADITELLKKFVDEDGAVCPKDGKYSVKLNGDTWQDGFEVQCSKHGGSSLGDKDTIQKVSEILKGMNVSIDSGAGILNGSNAQSVKEKLKEAGFDLDAMGAKTWKYDKDMLFWTDEDISDASPGTQVPTIRYNTGTGTYTVWVGTVTSKTLTNNSNVTDTTPYNALENFKAYTPSTSLPKDEQTYEKAQALLKAAQTQ